MKKGFTLIEMLGIITILAIVLLISFPAISKSLKTTKENINKNFLNNLKISAEAYIELNREKYSTLDNNGTVTITVGDLYNSNLLKGEYEGVNNNDTVTIEKNENGTLIFYYNDQIISD